MLDYYRHSLSHLGAFITPAHWTSLRRQVPYKTLLLLAVMDLIAKGSIKDNFIALDVDVEDAFNGYWTRFVGLKVRRSNVALPFFHLRHDGFWHLVPQSGTQPLNGATPPPASMGQLKQIVRGATLDEPLFRLLSEPASRPALRAAVADAYVSTAARIDSMGTVRSENLQQEPVHGAMPSADIREPVDRQDSPSPEISRDALTFPLLSPECMHLLDALGPEWPWWALTHGSIEGRRSLSDLGIKVFGDLQAVGPLAALGLASGALDSIPEVEEFWPSVARAARAAVSTAVKLTLSRQIASHIENILTHPETVAGGSPSAMNRAVTTTRDVGHSALFFNVRDLLDVLNGTDASVSLQQQTPVGTRELTFARSELYSMPLLSQRVRRALGAVGCDVAAMPLSRLALQPRTFHACRRAGDETANDLAVQSFDTLLARYQFGPKTIEDVIGQLRNYLAPWLEQLPLDTLVPLEAVPQEGAVTPQGDQNWIHIRDRWDDRAPSTVEGKTPQAAVSRESLRPREGRAALLFPLDAVFNAIPWLSPAYRHADASLSTYSLEDVSTNSLLSARVFAELAASGCDVNQIPLDVLASREGRIGGQDLRVYNTLLRRELRTLADLCSLTPVELLELRNFGISGYTRLIRTVQTYLQPWLDRLAPDAFMAPQDTAMTAVGGTDVETAGVDGEFSSQASPADSGRDPRVGAVRTVIALLDCCDAAWRGVRLDSLPIEETAREALLSSLGNMPLGELLESGVGLFPARDLAADERQQVITAFVQGIGRWMAERVTSSDAFEDTIPARSIAALNGVTVEMLLVQLVNISGLRRTGRPPESDALPREARVLFGRHGVRDGAPQTLGEIGATLKLTRERTRQIEKRAEDALLAVLVRPLTEGTASLVNWAVRAAGGVATLPDVASRIGSWLPFGTLHPQATTRLLARWAPGLHLLDRDVLVASPFDERLVRRVTDAARGVVDAQPGGMPLDHLIYQVRLGLGPIAADLPIEFVRACILAWEGVVCSGQYCWPARRGALLARMIHALRTLGRPAHFREIAAEFRNLYPDESARTDNAVHGFFDRFPEVFVLVGLGTFALAEAGYDPKLCSVPAVVEHILEQADRPLHVSDVIDRAKDKYRWKDNSIAAQLATNPRICPFGNGFFGLRDREYGDFDPSDAYAEVFGDTKDPRDRLVIGTFTNANAHRVVQVKLTPASLNGFLRITSRPLREILPVEGRFQAECWVAGEPAFRLSIARSRYDLHDLRPLFKRGKVRPGDNLFIEQLNPQPGEDPCAYRLAVAAQADIAGAMRAVGLSQIRGGSIADTGVLHYARDPEQVRMLLSHAFIHPWTAASEVNPILGYVPGSPNGPEYVRLGRAAGLLASGTVEGMDTSPLVRPTALGRVWLSSADVGAPLGRSVALSLPAYRTHLRAVAHGSGREDSHGDAAKLLGQSVIKAWDAAYGVRTLGDVSMLLDAYPAVVPTVALTAPALAALLLLLMAQRQGQGVSVSDALAHTRADRVGGLDRLRQLGLWLAEDGRGQVALNERVQVAVSHVHEAARRLRDLGTPLGRALAVAWTEALASGRADRAVTAADLLAALEREAADVLHPLLLPPPAILRESVRFADAPLLRCDFPQLVADWGWHLQSAQQAPFTFLSHADRLARRVGGDRLTVCLSGDVLAQSWAVEQHLSANAHLALLVLAASDLGGLADRICQTNAGWSFDGEPLVPALDHVLCALGYEVWDEGYRGDEERAAALGRDLLALAVRLGLIVVMDGRLEVIGSIAPQVYYGAYDLIPHVREALADCAVRV